MKKLSKEEMKKIIGGMTKPGKKCFNNSDCDAGEKCMCLPGIPDCVCGTVDRGATCTSDSDCGNGQHCVFNPVGDKWCN